MMDLRATYEKWKTRLLNWVRNSVQQRWFNLGLRTKMGVMVTVGLLGLISVFALMGISSTQQVTQQVLNQRVMLARLTATTLDSSLQHVRSALVIAVHQVTIQEHDASPSDLEMVLGDTFEQISKPAQGIYLLDSSGRILASINDGNPNNIQWVDVKAVQQAFQTTLHTPSYLSLVPENQPWVVIAVPVINPNGAPERVLATVLDLKNPAFFLFERPLDLGRTGVIDVVDSNGLVLLSTNPDRMMQISDQQKALSKLRSEDEPIVETCLGCEGNELGSSDVVIAFAPLEQMNWGVVVQQRADEVFAPSRRLSIEIFVLAVITIAGALGMVWMTTNSVIAPVQLLTEAAIRITEGNLDTPIENPQSQIRRNDEIGVLTNIFIKMRRRLKDLIDEIQSLNRDLDNRVRERTQAALTAQYEAQAARDNLLHRNQELSILNAVSNTVSQSLDLEEIINRALVAMLQLTEIDAGAVFLLDDTQGNLQLMAYRGLSEEAARLASQSGLLNSSCSGVLESGQVAIEPDLSHYKGRRARSLQREKLTTLVHVPLSAKGHNLGSMCVGTHRLREFSQEEQDLLVGIANQIAIAIENARLYAEVQHKEQIRGELFKKAINAQEEERKRIARELHDDTSQNLTAMLYACEEGMEMDDLGNIKERLQNIYELVQRTLDGVHKHIFDLRPSMLDHLGLVPALRWLARSRLESKGIRVTLEETSVSKRLPAEVETALFRVVQETISNIARHSASRNVCILFNFSDHEATVRVEDDGIGFDPNSLEYSPENPRGLGLMNMQERVELLGGDVEVTSSPGFGTQIYVRVPLDGRRSSDA